MFERILKVLATWFGCGLIPRAPGTVGTLGAIPLFWFMSSLNPIQYMIFTFAFVVLAMWVAQMYELVVSEKHDCPEFVMDEVAGFLVAMVWVPFTWQNVAMGFALFRFFDVLKPFPISWIDRRVHGGVGTVGDDLAAGIVVNVILQIVIGRF